MECDRERKGEERKKNYIYSIPWATMMVHDWMNEWMDEWIKTIINNNFAICLVFCRGHWPVRAQVAWLTFRVSGSIATKRNFTHVSRSNDRKINSAKRKHLCVCVVLDVAGVASSEANGVIYVSIFVVNLWSYRLVAYPGNRTKQERYCVCFARAQCSFIIIF